MNPRLGSPIGLAATGSPVPRTRIVAIGDSTTAGTPGFKSPVEVPSHGSGNRESQYAWWLMQARPGWEVLNRGVNGQRSDEIRARFELHVVQERPAAAILIAGVNDVYQGRPASHVIEQLSWMYEAAAREGIRLIAGTIIPYNTATPEQNAMMREINQWIRRQAQVNPKVAFVDTRAAVAAPGWPDMLSETDDQLHPTPAGYRAMADAIRPVLESVLR